MTDLTLHKNSFGDNRISQALYTLWNLNLFKHRWYNWYTNIYIWFLKVITISSRSKISQQNTIMTIVSNYVECRASTPRKLKCKKGKIHNFIELIVLINYVALKTSIDFWKGLRRFLLPFSIKLTGFVRFLRSLSTICRRFVREVQEVEEE